MEYNKTNIISKMKMLLGENIAVSFPIPCVENGIRAEKCFVYRMSFDKTKTRPFAMVVTAMSDGTILEFSNCHFKDFMDTAAHPFSEKISYELPCSSIGAKELKSLNDELYSLYNVVRTVAFQSELSELETSAVDDYKALFDKVVPISLLPYYHALGNEFFEWINQK